MAKLHKELEGKGVPILAINLKGSEFTSRNNEGSIWCDISNCAR